MPSHGSIRDAVAAADRQPIVDSLESLQRHWERGRWLGTKQPLRAGHVEAGEGRRRRDTTKPDLTEYIGASTLGHCFDGWSYLGRATEAELAGDPGSARHLGYYAELRAAMSLLGRRGDRDIQRQPRVG